MTEMQEARSPCRPKCLTPTPYYYSAQASPLKLRVIPCFLQRCCLKLGEDLRAWGPHRNFNSSNSTCMPCAALQARRSTQALKLRMKTQHSLEVMALQPGNV